MIELERQNKMNPEFLILGMGIEIGLGSLNFFQDTHVNPIPFPCIPQKKKKKKKKSRETAFRVVFLNRNRSDM